jgi:hypothetical protein
MHSYDAIKADIWACGAILHYLLLHCLPYGYSDFAHLLPMRDSLLTLWQLERKSWRVAVQKKEARLLKKTSPEAQDLLDQLLNPDEDARITLQGVKKHPWMQRRLPAMYERALQNMNRQQQQLSQQRGPMAEDGKLLAKAVQQMFEVASSKGALEALARRGPGAELVLDLDYGHSMVSLRGNGECRQRVRPAVEAVQEQVRELLAQAGQMPEPSGTSCASTGWAPDPGDLATTSTCSAAVNSSTGLAPSEVESALGEEQQQSLGDEGLLQGEPQQELPHEEVLGGSSQEQQMRQQRQQHQELSGGSLQDQQMQEVQQERQVLQEELCQGKQQVQEQQQEQQQLLQEELRKGNQHKEQVQEVQQEQQQLLQEELYRDHPQEQQQQPQQLQDRGTERERVKDADSGLLVTCFACGASVEATLATAKPQAVSGGGRPLLAAQDLADCPSTPKLETEVASIWNAVSSI